MKPIKYIIATGILMVSFMARGQADSTYFFDLFLQSEADTADQITLVQGDSTVRISKGQFLYDVYTRLLTLEAGFYSYTFTNGIAESSGIVKLGDTIQNNTYITAEGQEYGSRGSYISNSASFIFYSASARFIMTSYPMANYSSTNGFTKFNLDHNDLFSIYSNGTDSIEWDFRNLTIKDGINWKGLSYDGYYSHNFTNFSLVNKSYVDSIAGNPEDTVQLGDIVALKEDTTLLWAWAFTDSSQFKIGVKLGLWKYFGPDTLFVTKAVSISEGSPNFSYNVHWTSDISGTDTDMFTSAVIVAGSDATSTGEEDNPSTNSIPPGSFVYIMFTDKTAVPPDGAGFSFEGYEY